LLFAFGSKIMLAGDDKLHFLTFHEKQKVLGALTVRTTTVSIMTASKMSLTKTALSITIQYCDTEQNNTQC
jgi:hypothetical protein